MNTNVLTEHALSVIYRPWKRRTIPPDISAGSLRSPGIG